MIDPTLVFERLFETFDKSSIHPFRNFIARNTGITKWMIAADYCLHDKARPNNAFVFSLIPYDDWFGALRDEIRSALPRDLKRTKTVEGAATDFLASDRRFHIAFLWIATRSSSRMGGAVFRSKLPASVSIKRTSTLSQRSVRQKAFGASTCCGKPRRRTTSTFRPRF